LEIRFFSQGKGWPRFPLGRRFSGPDSLAAVRASTFVGAAAGVMIAQVGIATSAPAAEPASSPSDTPAPGRRLQAGGAAGSAGAPSDLRAETIADSYDR
jgi:hypothetical protein